MPKFNLIEKHSMGHVLLLGHINWALAVVGQIQGEGISLASEVKPR